MQSLMMKTLPKMAWSVFFKLHLNDTNKDQDHLLQEFLLLTWQRFGCWLVDQQIPFSSTQFSYAPPIHVDEYNAMFSGRLVFNTQVSGCYIHTRYLQLPIVKDEQQLTRFLTVLREIPIQNL